jgi:pimeloyl-ACP methyl ester carboxylesterase
MPPLPPNPPTPFASSSSPRLLYLHGFASGPNSTKGRAFESRLARLGVATERLDLRIPNMEYLRASAMVAHTRERIGGERDRAVLVGSSLGGLIAAHVAEVDARVGALILMAPAFGLLGRWQARLGAQEWNAWQERGWLEVDDWANGGKARVDFGFARDLEFLDAMSPESPDVRVPTLVLHGTRDDTVGIETSRAWAAGKRNVTLVELDDGHELTTSLPLILAEAERFLAPWIGRVS